MLSPFQRSFELRTILSPCQPSFHHFSHGFIVSITLYLFIYFRTILSLFPHFSDPFAISTILHGFNHIFATSIMISSFRPPFHHATNSVIVSPFQLSFDHSKDPSDNSNDPFDHSNHPFYNPTVVSSFQPYYRQPHFIRYNKFRFLKIHPSVFSARVRPFACRCLGWLCDKQMVDRCPFTREESSLQENLTNQMLPSRRGECIATYGIAVCNPNPQRYTLTLTLTLNPNPPRTRAALYLKNCGELVRVVRRSAVVAAITKGVPVFRRGEIFKLPFARKKVAGTLATGVIVANKSVEWRRAPLNPTVNPRTV